MNLESDKNSLAARIAAKLSELSLQELVGGSVVVIVPTDLAALSYRRRVSLLTGGVADVRFTTLTRLIAQLGLGAPSSLSMLFAVRSGLRKAGYPAWDHARTAATVAQAVKALIESGAADELDETKRELLRRTNIDLYSLLSHVQEAVSPSRPINNDSNDLIHELNTGCRYIFIETGRVLTPREGQVLGVLAEAGRLQTITVDDPPPLAEVLAKAELITTADVNLEVQAALSKAFEYGDSGLPLHRVAILYPRFPAYPSLIRAHLSTSGLNGYGEKGRRVSAGRCGILALALLELTDGTAAGERIDRIAREADFEGRAEVIGQLRRLGVCGTLERIAEAAVRPPASTFLRGLIETVKAFPTSGDWETFIEWIAAGLRPLAGAEEVDAYVEALTPLRELQAIAPSPSIAEMRFALDAVGAKRSRPDERFDSGLFFGTYDDAEGLEFDAVIGLGFQQELMPSRPRTDLLLPEETRTALGLPPLSASRAEQERQLARVLVPASRVSAVFARTAAGEAREAVPSPWFLQALSDQAGRTISFEQAVCPRSSGLADKVVNSVSSQIDFSARMRPVSAAGSKANAWTKSAPRAGNREIGAGAGKRVFEGADAFTSVPIPLKGTSVSVSGLQTFFECPYQFFLGALCRIRPASRLADSSTLDPMRLGSVIHEALRSWALGFIWRALVPGGEGRREGLDEEALAQLLEQYEALPHEAKNAIAGAKSEGDSMRELCRLACSRAETDGWVIPGPRWTQQCREIENGLANYAGEEARRLSQGPSTPVLMEHPFTLYVPGEWAIQGRLDRIDINCDSRHRLIDYKTGKSKLEPHKKPLLQLPIYQEAYKQLGRRTAIEGEVIDAAYVWPLTGTEMELGRDAVINGENLDEWLELASGAMASGTFLPRPEGGKFKRCDRCDFRIACPVAREAIWSGMSQSSMTAYAKAIEGEAKEPPEEVQPEDVDCTPYTPDPVLSGSDDPARKHIVEELGKHVFIEAGAGSGKTTLLVERLFRLLTADGPERIKPNEVAAITFTKKAAAEVLERLRDKLEAATHDRPHAREALESFDDMYLGTIHGFCLQILHDFPHAAGLPLLLEPLDERGEAQERHRFVRSVSLKMLRGEPARLLERFMGTGVPTNHIQAFAEDVFRVASALEVKGLGIDPLDKEWELSAAARAVRLARSCSAASTKISGIKEINTFVQSILDVIAAADERHSVESNFDVPARRAEEGDGVAAEAKEAADGEIVAWLASQEFPRPRIHKRLEGNVEAEAFRESMMALKEAVDDYRRSLAHPLLSWIVEEAKAWRADMRVRGMVSYDEQLLYAKQALEDPECLAAVSKRLKALFVDEFQDTDPVQAEIMEAILDAGRTRLFMVGDPKQAIYRFRGADVGAYLRMKDRFQKMDRNEVLIETLDSNFRSREPIIRWVNHTCGKVFDSNECQVQFTPLAARRELSDDDIRVPEPEVRVLPVYKGEADLAARIRYAMTADALQELCGEGRPFGWDDAAILLASRTRLELLEQELRTRGIPFRRMMGDSPLSSQEGCDLRAVIKAIADPGDEAAETAALLSQFFGCTLAELYQQRSGAVTDGEVASALGELARLRLESNGKSMAELTAFLIEECGIFRSAATLPNPGESFTRWSLLQRLAADFDASIGGSATEFIDFLEDEESRSADLSGSRLSEEDLPGVSLLTVHAAKGQEYPVVACCCFGGGQPAGPTTWAKVIGDGFEWSIGVKAASVKTPDADAFMEADAVANVAEKERLAYVAATRAKDVLILNLHVSDKAPGGKLLRASGPTRHLPIGRGRERPAELPEPKPFDFVVAQAQIRETMALPTTAVTRLAEEKIEESEAVECAYEPDDLDLPKIRRGEDRDWSKVSQEGIRFGRALHAVLQVHPMAGTLGDDEWSAIAAREGIEHRLDELRKAVERAWTQVRDRVAISVSSTREAYVSLKIGSGLLEGYIDLMLQDQEGRWHVFDYKTDRVSGDAAIAKRMETHRLQGGAYAAMLNRLGRPAASVSFLFVMAKSGQWVQEMTGAELAAAEKEAIESATAILSRDRART